MEQDGQRLSRMEHRLDEIQALLAELCQRLARSPTNPSYISLDTAAQLTGKTKQAIAKLVQRENDKLGGLKIRRIKGSVHRKDFLNFLEHKTSKYSGRGERIRAALKEMRCR